MVIPYLHLHAGKIEQILHLRHAGTDLRVHDDDALHAGVIDLFYILKVYRNTAVSLKNWFSGFSMLPGKIMMLSG